MLLHRWLFIPTIHFISAGGVFIKMEGKGGKYKITDIDVLFCEFISQFCEILLQLRQLLQAFSLGKPSLQRCREHG